MEQNYPILSCAGRPAETIDSALLNELLLSFTPDTIGIKLKASNTAHALQMIADGIHANDVLERFKDIITTEFLSVQLMEASSIARKEREKYLSNCF